MKMIGGFATRWLRKDRLAYVVGFAILLIVALVAYFPPHNLSIEANDQLDSVIPLFDTLPSPLTTLFRPGYVHEQFMHGLPLDMMGVGDLKIVRLIYGILPQYWDTSIYFTVALLALYLSAILPFSVARRHFADKSWMPQLDPAAIAFGAGAVALMPHSFAVLGAIIGFNLFVAGAMFSFVPNRTWSALGLFLLAAMFADFVLGGLFYYPAALVVFAIFGGMNGNWRPLKLVALGLLITIFIEYRLFWGLLFSDTESHRVLWLSEGAEWHHLANILFWREAVTQSVALVDGSTIHNHYQWNTGWLPFLAIGASLVYLSARFLQSVAFERKPLTETLDHNEVIIIRSGAFAILVGFLIVAGFGFVQSNLVDFRAILQTPVQFSRFIVSLPFLSVIIISLSASLYFNTRTGLTAIIISNIILVAGLVVISITIHEPLKRRLDNIEHRIANGAENPFIPQYTVGTLYLRGSFNETKAYLGPDWVSERVITVGLPTMAAAYNGFRTLDGYFQSHPLDYHLAFREVIAPALERDPARMINYDGWGNRVEIPITAYNEDGTIELYIDGCAFADLGGTLVISAHAIANPEDSQLRREVFISGNTDGLTSNVFLYRPACGEAELDEG